MDSAILDSERRDELVAAAWAATSKAFLAKPHGVRYGSAVLTASGKVLTSGQYSSFNHATNVHAEQGALLVATMIDTADVLALAIASTGNQPVVRPCGICRQFMLEHSLRTGRDFEVLMAHRDRQNFDCSRVSELLPWAWVPEGVCLDTKAADSA